MVDFIRGLLSIVLKANDSLYFAIMIGCLRITKESIFTGLNNLEIISIEHKFYGEYFGFTDAEVVEMLKYYGKEEQYETIKEWYNGYLFGNTKVYNPWSLVNFIKSICFGGEIYPKPYWSNTSSNSIIKELVEHADATTQMDLETLVEGKSFEKPIHEDVTYEEIYKSSDNLWNFLYFTGYLRKVSERFEDGQLFARLEIPNMEIASIYRNHILEWTRNKVIEKSRTNFFDATFSLNIDAIETEIKQALRETISYFDGGGSFYHGYTGFNYRGFA